MNNDFIIFSLPEKEKFYLLSNIYNGNQKIEFSTFDKTKNIIFQNSTVEEIFLRKSSLKNFNSSLDLSSIELCFNHYEIIIQKCINKIKMGKFKKIVISRIKKFNYSKISIAQTLIKLRIKFPKSFIYFFKKNKLTWLGATPELLGKLSFNEFETMSLAGTIEKNKIFHSKEIIEQQLVTDFIKSIIKKYSRSIKVTSTYEYHYNNLKHLVTYIRALINPLQYEKLLNELHPTPAICGLPQYKTFEFINKIEPHSRELYCGKIKINLDHQLNISFINLRCLKLFKNHFEIFSGSGITELSNPKKEWHETEIKINSVEENIVYN